MIIECVTSGPVDTNAYLVADEDSGEAMIVDAPLQSTDELMRRAQQQGVRIMRIVDTHGYWDHVADNAALVAATGAPLLIHEADAARLAAPASEHQRLPFTIAPSTPTGFLHEGDVLPVGAYRFQVLHTPGHTPGS